MVVILDADRLVILCRGINAYLLMLKSFNMLDQLGAGVAMVVISFVTTAAFGGVLAYFRKKTICLQKLANDSENLKKRAYRIEKALIILVKLQEDAVAKTHPEIKPEWEEIVKELLKGNIDDE
jgi:hypothetical protein